jgi:undecaprenyl phosphate N,N'-diacetylbacillosamine 1-phosphate transferase
MHLKLLSRVWKRCFDVTMAITVLIIFAPLILLIVILIKLTSRGPVFFIQERIGWHRRSFKMIKFRSMEQNAPYLSNPDGSAYSSDADSRVTRFGRILRQTSLDELAQLWNVLRGEMSLIGPRPELPEGTRTYQPDHFKRLDVRPGMTGWAVVHGRNHVPICVRRNLDVWYADHVSFLLDLRIIGKTIAMIARSEGVNRTDGSPPLDALPECGLEAPRCSTEN